MNIIKNIFSAIFELFFFPLIHADYSSAESIISAIIANLFWLCVIAVSLMTIIFFFKFFVILLGIAVLVWLFMMIFDLHL